MDYSITQNGKPLDRDLYRIDTENKVFNTVENSLVLEFSGEFSWTFRTGRDCTFITGWGCSFDTDRSCTFNTGGDCSFHTHDRCIFNSITNCTFTTGDACTFDTFDKCTFITGNKCTFRTDDKCIFDTGDLCTFSLTDISTHMFKSGSSGVMIDRKGGKHYLLNDDFIILQKVLKG